MGPWPSTECWDLRPQKSQCFGGISRTHVSIYRDSAGITGALIAFRGPLLVVQEAMPALKGSLPEFIGPCWHLEGPC